MQNKEMPAPGRTAARYLRAMAVGGGDLIQAASFAAESRWLDSERVKGLIDAHMLGTAPQRNWAAESFVDYLRPRTIVGQLAALFRPAAFGVGGAIATAGTQSWWTAEGGSTAPSAMAFSATEPMQPRKISAMSVISNELARASAADEIVSRDLARACAHGLDTAFVDGQAGTDARPAAVNANAVTVASAGSILKDAAAALAAFGGLISSAAWIAHPRTAAAAGLQHGENTQANIGATGGTLAGLPVVTSEAMAENTLLLIDAGGIEMAMDDTAELRTGNQGAVEMVNPATGAAELVSLYQNNLTALLALLRANWRVVGPAGSVVQVTGAAY